MKLTPITPKKSLNKAFLTQQPTREEIDLFKQHLIRLLGKIDEIEREENQKNHVRDFLRDTYYKDTNEVNTKGTIDLVIHLGKTNKDPVGAILEAKRPSNKTEMFSVENPNVKALGESILYYMEERNTANNNELKNLVITNVYEWYIIDANYYDKHIYRNSKIKKLYDVYKNDKKDTPFFYDEISKIIPTIEAEIPCVYFDIRDYQKWLQDSDSVNDKYLIPLQKILSPYNLLKVKFADDSNTLNSQFYKELLYILGLEEVKEGNKWIIRRKIDNRNEASLLENTIDQLKLVGLHKISDLRTFGVNSEEQYDNVALELCITWMNRILFLKLLEGQLVSYHKGNREFKFLNTEMIVDYDELSKLFHRVLAVDIRNRKPDIQHKYFRVPYLNSSLFEISKLEDQTVKINELDNSLLLNYMPNSILKEQKKHGDALKTLEYFFLFLDAYDFASEGSTDIKEDSKTIINASVLGKVFEKINGYKDGSIFTPGFITMYMSRTTIRLSVVQKFKETYGWHVEQFDDLKNYMADRRSVKDLLELNAVINSLRLCDPAVGSGHFLVSMLNELIVIKYELGILVDEKGVRVISYELDVINDELIITDALTVDPFKYTMINGKPQSKEIQRLQKTLFHEKQILIENCLFGVDINPNSVKISRLRLWIELLKSSYYKEETNFTELETLPNIDINIKCGNSLISRYALDIDIKKALIGSKWNVGNYRDAVMIYRNAQSKDEKHQIERLIDEIKHDFVTEIASNDKRLLSLNSLRNELYKFSNQTQLFELSKAEKAKFDKEVETLTTKIHKLETELEEIRNNKIYENAFEWRFEFPEVLNDEGDFVGFDVVIGNPPYFSLSSNDNLRIVSDRYKTYVQTGDVYALFYELGLNVVKKGGIQSLIISNKWMRANYGLSLRKFIIEHSNPLILIDFGQNVIFGNAVVHTNVIISKKSKYSNQLSAIRFEDNCFFNHLNNLDQFIKAHKIENLTLDENQWNIIPSNVADLKRKIECNHKRLKDWNIKINFGLKTSLNEAFIINDEKRKEIIKTDNASAKFIKPILRGRDTRSYYAEFRNLWILNIPKGYTIKTKSGRNDVVFESMPRYGNFIEENAWEWFQNKHPSVANHLLAFKQKAEKRDDKGDYWWELRACSYIGEFEKPKIIFSEIVSDPQFYYDEKGYYPEATVFFITGEKLKYLTALLNSKAVTFFFKSFYMGGELVGKIRYKKVFLEQIPIPKPTDKEEDSITKIVDTIIEFKAEGKLTNALETEIDQLVYQLYGLTEEEIKIIERTDTLV